MIWTVLCIVVCATGVLSQPDTTPCDQNGAYDTNAGTASCGGFQVSVKALVCGDGFTQAGCVAKWVNGGGENEWYFFMGAGSGMDSSMLPAPCSSLPSGLAMVQYYPDKQSCYPAADLAGTTIAYTAGSSGSTPASITLNFAEHDDGSDTRNGYIKITCDQSVNSPSFTTIGDSNQASFYEVDTKAKCAGASAPSGSKGAPKASGGETGGILIAVFLGGFAVYFLVGFGYNMKVKQLEGTDRIPHYEFWTSLPGLAKEGVRFTKAKITKSDYAPL